MKDLKHIKKFNEASENLNISDVSRTYTIKDIERAFIMGGYYAVEDVKEMKMTKDNLEALKRFYKHWVGVLSWK